MPRETKVLEGIVFEEHNGSDSVDHNYAQSESSVLRDSWDFLVHAHYRL